MSDNKTALVTGASGFVGSHLTRRLLADGWTVHAIVLPLPDLGPLEPLRHSIRVFPHDGTTEGMFAILKESKPDVAFHLASLFLSQHRAADIATLVQSNVTFGTQLLDAMAAHGARRLVNTGTSWQHYQGPDYNPVNLYAATKQAFEDILRFYVESGSVRAITLKLFDTYGPNDPRPKLFHLLQKVAASGEPLEMSPGEQLVDLVYIDDIVNAFVQAADRLRGSECGDCETYAVSSGQPLSLKGVVKCFEQAIGRPLPVRWGGRPYRPREVMRPWDQGLPLPGWRPKFSLAEGIARMLGADARRS